MKNDNIQFNPQFTYLEDRDFLILLARKWEFAYVSVSLTNYRMHAASASATKVEGFRREMGLLINKFSALYPEVAEKFADQLRALNRKDSAMDNWRKGERNKARHLIFGDLGVKPRLLLIYLAMFLPYNYIDWIRQKLFKRSIGYYH